MSTVSRGWFNRSGDGDTLKVAAEKSAGRSHAVFATFVENRPAVGGVVVVVFAVLFCFVGPLIYHTNQVATNLPAALQAPSASHLLGTDSSGYDELGRLMLGGQSTIEVGLAAALLAGCLGTAWGTTAGYLGGFVDDIMMRFVDALMAIPALIILLIVASVTTPSIPLLIVAIGGISWLNTARLVRSETLSLRTLEYVEASRVVGSRARRVVTNHIVPNVMGTVVVQITFSVADSILLLAGLSYLGLGPPPPATNWGGMLSQGLNYAYDNYWWLIFPAGLAIVLVVVSFNMIGDALRDVVEVRFQKK
jgi:peptide/nickel transport system permease protein